jgi:hypothetical protein
VRGCLFVVVLAATIVFAAVWFLAQPVASDLVAAALEASGFHADSSTIRVSADPPPKLLIGRADEVTIDGTTVDWQMMHAARLTLTLDHVDLVARTATTIHGAIIGVELQSNAAGGTATADVAVDGSTASANATISVDGPTVSRLVVDAVARELGVKATGATLIAPDQLRVTAAGISVEGRLTIDATGSLSLVTPLGSVAIFRLDPTIPLQLHTVRVVDGVLQISGTLDAEALWRG